MVRFLLGIVRDLYVVLLVIFLVEQIPGGPWSDLLHDLTRKGVLTVTICVVVAKLVQPFVEGSGGGPVRTPRRQKKMEGGKNQLLEWASAEMQGWRPAMEDATCVVDSLPEPLVNQALFAVFDGHGGAQVSSIVSKEFPKVLAACANNLSKAEGSQTEGKESQEGPPAPDAQPPATETSQEPIERAKSSEAAQQLTSKALHLAMLTMDSYLRKGGAGQSARSAVSGPLSLVANQLSPDKSNAFSLVGSTAIVVLIESDNNGTHDESAPASVKRLTVANCGDSRAVLCRKGKAIELSEDHKPELPREEERIKKAGGHVAMIGPCHRVDGWGLNLSRALGDFHYKARADLPPDQQKVIAVPEIKTLELTEDDEFLMLGCDGVFELNTSQKAIDIVSEAFRAGLTVEQAVEDLVDKSCSSNLVQTRGKGGDNCSAIVVRLR